MVEKISGDTVVTGDRSQGANHLKNEDDNVKAEANRNADEKSSIMTNEEAGLGDALRSIYQQTVREDIPSEMLDLLKRLD